jgi:hypothetical protein
MLDTVAQTFTEHAENSFLAVVWPAAKGNENTIESILSKVVYKKKIKLNYNGAHNLLAEAYKGEPWLGALEKNYPGIKNKLVGCFPDFSEVRIFIFQADSLSDVLTLKDKVRDVFNIEKHAIHITDTQEETIRLGRLLLNENGIHFLNYAYPRKFINSKRQDIPQFLSSKNLDNQDVLFDDSLVMDLYGFHRCDRISYLLSLSQYEESNDKFLNEFYTETKSELIDHPKNHFWFKGIKYISIEQVYQMKLLRRTSRDMTDIKLIKSLIKNTKIKEKLDLISCNLYFKKIVLIRHSKLFIGNLLRKTGLFNLVKKILN